MTTPKRPQPIEPSAAEVERLVAQQYAALPKWWGKSVTRPRGLVSKLVKPQRVIRGKGKRKTT